MAATAKPISAFDYCKEYLKKMPLEQVQAQVLDDINKEIWMAAPWRWTIGAFANFNLAANTTDYTISSMPSDFLYILKATLTNGTRSIELEVEPALSATPVSRGTPAYITIVPGGTNYFRVYNPFGSIATGETWTCRVLYKKTAPIITKKNSHTAGVLVMDDEWFWVYREGCMHRAYQFGDDDRAGAATVAQNGQVQYSGQLGIYKAALNQMKMSEPMLNMRPQTDPERSQG